MNIVFFTQRVEIVESYGERRDCADQRISEFISACGFLPIPLPNKCELLGKVFSQIKPAGIVLTGGNSLVQYGGNAPERDAVDEELIKIALQKRIPLYGFCRGMQSILSYFGNHLINVENHVAVRHVIREGTVSYEVNSFHNQACVQLKESSGLTVKALSEDGVIEAVCHEHFPILGTMWHPERESVFDERDIARVKELFCLNREKDGEYLK